jgi:hypothetical protein
MNLQLNIGLGNNPYSYSEVVSLVTTALTHGGCSNVECRQSAGKYVEQAEDNVIVSFEYSDEWEWLTRRIKALSTLMNQECIAVYIPNWITGDLLYPDHFTGERYTFDIQYFEKY